MSTRANSSLDKLTTPAILRVGSSNRIMVPQTTNAVNNNIKMNTILEQNIKKETEENTNLQPMTVLPAPVKTKKDFVPKAIISKKRVPREEHFLCLCKKCKCDNSAFSFFVKTLCGYPLYSCTIFVFLFLLITGLFVYFLYAVLYLKYANNSYFAPCYTNNDCNITQGLYCGTTVGVCNCPARNTVGRCDCSKGYYWNGTGCSVLLAYNSSGCVNDYNCDSSKRLVCLNGICQCTKPQIWLNTTCDYNYIGCFNDTSIYSIVPVWTSQNNNSRMSYVVETCTGYCYNLQFKFALVSIGNYVAQCYCQQNYSTIASSGLCNVMCPGIDANGYACGSYSYTYFNVKAVYQTI